MDRRTFIASTGYAMAVLPITHMAIKTPDTTLVAGPVTIPVGGENIPGYAARPKKGGPFPVVLVVQEIFGLHEYIKDVCRRLAAKGYYAVAPDLYKRQGDPTRIADIETLRAEIVSKVPLAQVMSDLDATMAFLAADKAADVSHAYITGYCWGGTMVWLYAAHNPKMKAGVAWYGRLTGTANALQTTFPIEIAGTLTVPVLGLYAANDKGIPLTDVEAMKKALGARPSKIIVYPGTEHGFHADYRPSYNKKAAEAGWRELLGWFNSNR